MKKPSSTSKTTQKKNDVAQVPVENSQQTGILSLNVVHLVVLHGMVLKVYDTEGIDSNMKNFLHDLLIMFEIYLDSVEDNGLHAEIKKKFNFSPINS